MSFFSGEYFIQFTEDFGIRWYGLLITVAVILGLIILAKGFARRGYPVDHALDMAIIGIISGLIGARAYYVIWEWQTYKADPISVFYVWKGGLAIYGGVLAGALAIYIYSRIKKYKVSVLMDLAAPALVLGQAIGRWGNFFNNEAFGNPVTDKALQFFPYAIRIPFENRPAGMKMFEWFQATFFYESVACLLIFIFLMLYRKRQKFDGEIILLYLYLYGIERAIVEGMRTDSLYLFNTGIRVSQLLSIILVVISAAILVYMYVRFYKKKNTAASGDEPSAISEEDADGLV
ncbi:MAG TPA: prolipoprotein diacylglyceryl transferase [Clostridia bacterium]|nr:prolipoprotein diacylglyceryl transferase [Clostridia bacterium]